MISSKFINFIIEHIITRFGIPYIIIMDNGPNLKRKEMKNVYKKIFHIEQNILTPFYP